MGNHEETVTCQVCQQQKKRGEVVPGVLVRDAVVDRIREEHPDWTDDGYICTPDLNRYQASHVRDALAKEKGELSDLELQVAESVGSRQLLSRNVDVAYSETATYGEKLSDSIAEFGGSWRFIIIFLSVMTVWIGLNSVELIWKPFDVYPFILLNLILSCLAAIQAPIIMMSQNRQESKDRLRAEHDYQVNLKAEIEIRHLQEKIDDYLAHQWQSLLEIQRVQVEMMEKILKKG
jgi:uncharacterized membrane protein